MRWKKLWTAAAAAILSLASAFSVEAAWDKVGSTCYNNKGEVIEGAILKGIDVSSWQEKIDWKSVKGDGIDFAFIRVGHGGQPKDTRYEYNMSEAAKVGIPAGVYYYSRAMSVEESILDAQSVIKNLQGQKVSYPVVIDMEDSGESGDGNGQLALSEKERTDIAIAFCEEIQKAGYYPMIYCNEYWYNTYLDTSRITQYDLWIARYSNTYNKDIPRTVWQCTSQGRVAGIKGNADIDFAFVDYSSTITPRTASAASYIPTTGLWKQNSTGYWFSRLAGNFPANGWEAIDGAWYYFDGLGYMMTDWVNHYGIWYYLQDNGVMATGWVNRQDTWYYLNVNGSMSTDWMLVGDSWYYLYQNGSMATSWQLINGTWYYLHDSGAMATGWLNKQDTWYYLNNNGSMATGWQPINDTWYYLNDNGSMATGWQLINNTWYYLYDNGAMAKDTQIGDYYVNMSGAWV